MVSLIAIVVGMSCKRSSCLQGNWVFTLVDSGLLVICGVVVVRCNADVDKAGLDIEWGG